MGTAPDAFDGIHMKGEYLSDGSGAWNKPYMRSFVGGGTGVFAPIQGWYHVASGLFDMVLVVCEEKMSSFYPHAQAAFLTIFDHTTERPLKPNLLWIFAIEMNRYMTTYGLDKKDIAQVAVQHKRNAANHPCALLGDKDITVEDVLNSETLAWPVQRLDVLLLDALDRHKPHARPAHRLADRFSVRSIVLVALDKRLHELRRNDLD